METNEILKKELVYKDLHLLERFKPSGKFGDYRPFRLTERELTEEEWVDAREHGPNNDIEWTLGGSTVSMAIGINGYQSQLETYHKKVLGSLENCPEKELYKPAMEKVMTDETKNIFFMGHLYESVLAVKLKYWLQKQVDAVTGKKLYDDVQVHLDKHMYGCGEKNADGTLKYPYMVMNIDCIVMLKINGVWKMYLGEIKTLGTSNYEAQRDWKNNIVPPSYEVQVRYYMKGLNVDGAFIFCEWGRDENDCACIFIERNKVIEDELLSQTDAFIDMCKTKTEPTEVGEAPKALLNYYARFYGAPKEYLPKFEIPESYRDKIERIMELDASMEKNIRDRKALENARDYELAELFPLFKDSSMGYMSLTNDLKVYIASKQQRYRGKFNEEEFKKAYPSLYNSCHVSVFDLDKLKLEHADLVKEYTTSPGYKDGRDFTVRLYDAARNVTLSRIKKTYDVKVVKGLAKDLK